MTSKSNLGVNHVSHVSTQGPEKCAGIRDSRMKAHGLQIFLLLMKDLETDVHNVGAFSEPTVNRNFNFIHFCSARLLQDQRSSFTMPHEIIGWCHCGTCQGFCINIMAMLQDHMI